jgi:hypothetical protein
MPDKPLWLARIPEAVQYMEAQVDPWVDRAMLESLLQIGRRRAQQLLSPIATRRVGASIVARREEVIAHLNRIAAGETAFYEGRRRRQLWDQLGRVREEWMERPPVLVEVRNEQVRRLASRDIEGLPAGVELAPGRITVRFRKPEEALEKLMALALAIGHNRAAFEERVAVGAEGEAAHES